MTGTVHYPPALAAAIEHSADGTVVRGVMDRVLDAHPGIADELARNDLLRDGFVALAAASRSLSTALLIDVTLLDPLRDPVTFAKERRVDEYRASVALTLGDTSDRPAELRRWKGPPAVVLRPAEGEPPAALPVPA